MAAAVGLVVDARIHFRLAPAYDGVRTSALSQGDLFRAEGVLALVAAALILASGRLAIVCAVLAVAGGGLAALLLYRYVDVGTLGPLPSMYEPAWYPDKTHTVIAQVVACLAAAAVGFSALRGRRRKGARAGSG